MARAADASALAQQTGRRVEVLNERAEDSTTFANANGTFTTEAYSGPVRFRYRDQWVPVDLTLSEASDGKIRPAGHPAALVLAGDGDTEIARVTREGRRVSLGWDGSLASPRIEGTKVTYPEVRPGVDLVVEATRTGFEQFFVIKRRPTSQLDLPLTVSTHGMRTKSMPDGSTSYTDDKGRVVGGIGATVMWDASVDPRSGEPTRLRAVAKTDEVSTPTGNRMRLAPSADFLSDPATQFPVTIDPAVTLAPTFDTFVQNTYSSDQSASTELRLGTYDGGSSVARSFLNIPTGTIRGSKINSATLSLWGSHSYSCNARNWEVWSTGAASTATRWTAQPTWHTRYATTSETRGYSSSCADNWTNTNVTTLAQAWANSSATTHTIGLRAASETDTYAWKKFNSGNASAYVPKVSVNYNRYASASQQSVSHSAAYKAADGTTTLYVSTLRPTVSAVVSDPDGGNVTALFDVLNGSTVVATKLAGSAVPSGSRSALQLPSGLLADGGKYSFRVWARDAANLESKTATAATAFTVDTSAPQAPSVSSGTVRRDVVNFSAANDTFTFSEAQATRFTWSLDGGAPTSVTATSGKASVPVTSSAGWHKLSVQAVDALGRSSAATVFEYGSGVTSLPATPDAGAQVDTPEPALTMRPGYDAAGRAVTYEYTVGDQDGFANVVTSSGPIASTSWTVPAGTLKPGGHYQWRVTVNVAGATATSEPRKISVRYVGETDEQDFRADTALMGTEDAVIDGAIYDESTGEGLPRGSEIMVYDDEAPPVLEGKQIEMDSTEETDPALLDSTDPSDPEITDPADGPEPEPEPEPSSSPTAAAAAAWSPDMGSYTLARHASKRCKTVTTQHSYYGGQGHRMWTYHQEKFFCWNRHSVSEVNVQAWLNVTHPGLLFGWTLAEHRNRDEWFAVRGGAWNSGHYSLRHGVVKLCPYQGGFKGLCVHTVGAVTKLWVHWDGGWRQEAFRHR